MDSAIIVIVSFTAIVNGAVLFIASGLRDDIREVRTRTLENTANIAAIAASK